MVFQQWTDLAQVIGINVVDPEHRKRCCRYGNRARIRIGRSTGPMYSSIFRVSSKLLSKRNFVPLSRGKSHVDG